MFSRFDEERWGIQARHAHRSTERFAQWTGAEWDASACGQKPAVGAIMASLRTANPQSEEEWEAFYLQNVRTLNQLRKVAKQWWTHTQMCSVENPAARHTHRTCMKKSKGYCIPGRYWDKYTRQQALLTVLTMVVTQSWIGMEGEILAYQMLSQSRLWEDTGIEFHFASLELDFRCGVDIVGVLDDELVAAWQVKTPKFFQLHRTNPEAVLRQREKAARFRAMFPTVPFYFLNTAHLEHGLVREYPIEAVFSTDRAVRIGHGLPA